MPQLAEQQAKVDQIRVLINLVRNAAEAVLQVDSDGTKSNGSRNSAENPSVEVSWMVLGHQLIIAIEDTGPGLMNPTNAFVPFYTTKPAGSGIGLVLARQIAEAHGGSVDLQNRAHKRGCLVRITLPLQTAAGLNSTP